MGSFANGFHVRTDDRAAVAGALKDALAAAGFEPSAGWVSVLDSGLVWSPDLPAEVSRLLATHVIALYVYDSDSWHYALWHEGEEVDEFASPGAQEGSAAGRGPEPGDHLEALRPLLAPEAKDEHVLEALAREEAFAEEALARFLPLIGIPATYAYLSEEYLPEFSDEELAEEGVAIAERLRFARAGKRGAGLLGWLFGR